jgi:hypothetical protein
MSQAKIQEIYGIRWFTDALRDFFENNPLNIDPQDINTLITEHDHVTIYPKATQVINDELVTGITDIVHMPLSVTQRPGRVSSSCRQVTKSDTVLIRERPPAMGQHTYGMDSVYYLLIPMVLNLLI